MKSFYLLGSDKDFNSHTDYVYNHDNEALEDAERIYEIENIKWTQINLLVKY